MSQETPVEVFNISHYEAHDTAVLHVKTPRGEPLLGQGGLQVKIHVYSPGSPQFQKAKKAYEAAVTAAAYEVMRNPQAAAVDNSIRLEAEKLAACTARIENFPVEAVDLYANPKLGYITNQVERFGEAWSNFLPQFAKA